MDLIERPYTVSFWWGLAVSKELPEGELEYIHNEVVRTHGHRHVGDSVLLDSPDPRLQMMVVNEEIWGWGIPLHLTRTWQPIRMQRLTSYLVSNGQPWDVVSHVVENALGRAFPDRYRDLIKMVDLYCFPDRPIEGSGPRE